MSVLRECWRRLWGAFLRNPADHDRADRTVARGSSPFRTTQAGSVSNATMSRDSAPISTPIKWIAHPEARYLFA